MSDGDKTALEHDFAAAFAELVRSETFRRTLDYFQDADEDPDRLALVTGMITRAAMGVMEKPH